jgi:hypothetical protein
MRLSEELAQACVSAMRKQAADETAPEAARGQFESSALREQLLRRHADRLQELAKARAVEEDVTPGGYAETLGKRLIPMPHTLGEAEVRVPAMALGGAFGHYLARPYETPSADVIHSVLAGKVGGGDGKGKGPSLERRLKEYVQEQPAKRKTVTRARAAGGTQKALAGVLRTAQKFVGMLPPQVGKPAEKNLATLLKATQRKQQRTKARVPSTQPAAKVKKLVRWLSVQRPEHVEGALKTMPIFGRGESEAIRSKVTKSLGEGGLPFLRREIGLLGEPEVKTLSQRLGRLRWGGALAGALGAGALAGIPFAARALYQKRQGGEAAARARSDAQAALEDAAQEAVRREAILKELEIPNHGSETVEPSA